MFLATKAFKCNCAEERDKRTLVAGRLFRLELHYCEGGCGGTQKHPMPTHVKIVPSHTLD